MAFKFAFLAALCVAQAFAFPSSSEGLEDEFAKAVGNKDLRIVMGCFRLQEYNIMIMNKKIAEVAQNVVEDLDDDDIRESVAEQLKQTEKPVARIAIALVETHRTMYINLNRLDVVKAHEALLAGVQTIEGIMTEIRTALNQVKVEHPELTEAMDWYMRYLSSDMEVMIPKMRRDFGECLYRGRPSVLD